MYHDIFEDSENIFITELLPQNYAPFEIGLRRTGGDYPIQIQFPTNTKICASFSREMEVDTYLL